MTATSRKPGHGWAIGVAGSLLIALVAIPLISAPDSSHVRVASGGADAAGARLAAELSRLQHAPAPPGWTRATITSGGATLVYPADWKPIPGDTGTVTVSLRDSAGLYRGYLNVTPRQGAERLQGWAGFRTRRNSGEGDTRVHEVAAAKRLRIGNAQGSCVIDDYLSRVGSHPYRELACIVAGRRDTSVFVGAALQRDWPKLGPVVERAASALIER